MQPGLSRYTEPTGRARNPALLSKRWLNHENQRSHSGLGRKRSLFQRAARPRSVDQACANGYDASDQRRTELGVFLFRYNL